MKLKGISPLEQHVEQIVLVTVAGIFLLVIATQFLLEPNKVKVGSQTLPPGKAFEPVQEKAQQLNAQIDRTEVDLPEVPPLNLAEQFRQSLEGPVAPRAVLPVALGPTLSLEVTDSGQNLGAEPVTVPQIPAPAPVAAHAYRVTVDPTEPLSHPELKPLLPAEQPMDKAFVSMEAVVDGAAVRAALASAAGEARAMPDIWWAGDRTAVLAVRLDRQEMLESGQWGEPTEIQPLPGKEDLLARASKMLGSGDMADLVYELANGGQELVTQPAFYRTIAGEPWAPPSEVGKEDAGASPQVERLMRERRSLTEERDRKTIALQNAEGSRAPSRPEPRSGGGKGSGGGDIDSRPTTEQPNPVRLRLERELQNIETRLTANASKLREAGVGEDGAPLPDPTGAAGTQSTPEIAQPLLESESARIWNHDLTVVPGKTYRYRARFAINNPAFGRGASLIAEQQELAKQPAIFSQPSEWSQPVTVPADRYFFVTSASEANVAGDARAQVEVYQFFYGFYRRGTASLEPGDTIVAQVKLPESSKLPIFDLSKLPTTAPTQTATATQPNFPQPNIRPGAGGSGKAGGGMQIEGEVIISNPGRGQATGFETATAQEALQLPEGATGWDKPIVASEDVILLDVVRPPGDGNAVAVLRGSGGRLVKVEARNDPTGMLKLVADSAKAGETQGQPVVVAPPPEPVRPLPGVRPGQSPRDPTPPPAGGGAGGG